MNLPELQVPIVLANVIVLAHMHVLNTTWVYNIAKCLEAVWWVLHAYVDTVQVNSIFQ